MKSQSYNEKVFLKLYKHVHSNATNSETAGGQHLINLYLLASLPNEFLIYLYNHFENLLENFQIDDKIAIEANFSLIFKNILWKLKYEFERWSQGFHIDKTYGEIRNGQNYYYKEIKNLLTTKDFDKFDENNTRCFEQFSKKLMTTKYEVENRTITELEFIIYLQFIETKMYFFTALKKTIPGKLIDKFKAPNKYVEMDQTKLKNKNFSLFYKPIIRLIAADRKYFTKQLGEKDYCEIVGFRNDDPYNKNEGIIKDKTWNKWKNKNSNYVENEVMKAMKEKLIKEKKMLEEYRKK